MYLLTLKVVRERIEFDKLADSQWRAAFKGAFDVSAEAQSPEEARQNLESEIDRLVAAWIVRPPKRARVHRAPGRETATRKKSKTRRK